MLKALLVPSVCALCLNTLNVHSLCTVRGMFYGCKTFLGRSGPVSQEKPFLDQWYPTFLAPGSGFVEGQFFHRLGLRRWFRDDSSALHLLCTLCLLLLHQLHLVSSGIRSRRLGIPALEYFKVLFQKSLQKQRLACLGTPEQGSRLTCNSLLPTLYRI